MRTDAQTYEPPFPEVAELLPHGPSAVFLERVLERTSDSVACEVVPGTRDAAYAENGIIPAELGIEYMAQVVAVYAGLQGPAERRRELGYVIAVRKFRLHTSGFRLGEALIARATWEWGETSLARFFASIERDGESVASAFVSVFRPPPDSAP